MKSIVPVSLRSIMPTYALLLLIETSALANTPTYNTNKPETINSSTSLKEFSGRYTQKKINLNWSMANSSKTISFEVARSLVGQMFLKIGIIISNAKTSYQFTDKFIFQPPYFYCIKSKQ